MASDIQRTVHDAAIVPFIDRDRLYYAFSVVGISGTTLGLVIAFRRWPPLVEQCRCFVKKHRPQSETGGGRSGCDAASYFPYHHFVWNRAGIVRRRHLCLCHFFRRGYSFDFPRQRSDENPSGQGLGNPEDRIYPDAGGRRHGDAADYLGNDPHRFACRQAKRLYRSIAMKEIFFQDVAKSYGSFRRTASDASGQGG